MKYLFYDLEYASQSHGKSKICEFGYVVTNENFEILDENIFIIDPNIPYYEWDSYVVKNLLNRRKSEYLKSPLFDAFYDRISNLINNADYVFGHSLNGDAKALNDELERYNLKAINYEFYDIKEIFKKYFNIRRDVSVVNILKKLEIDGDDRAHDAKVDSYNVMLELKKMMNELEVSLPELIMLCDFVPDKSIDYKVESIERNSLIRKEKIEKLGNDSDNNMLRKWSRNNSLFIAFLDNVKPTENCEQNLKGQSVSISINYEENHFRQMMNLVQLICNHGGEYVKKASKGTIFVPYPVLNDDGTERKCSKGKYVKEANENGANIKIMSFEDLLALFNLTEQQLDELPMVSIDCLYRKDAVIKSKKIASIVKSKKKANNYHNKIANDVNFGIITIGDAMKDANIEMNNYID